MKKGFNELGRAIHQSEVVFRKTHGKCIILNTDWPVESFVSRETYGGKITGWLATYNLCNGVPTGAQQFGTKAEAIASIS